MVKINVNGMEIETERPEDTLPINNGWRGHRCLKSVLECLPAKHKPVLAMDTNQEIFVCVLKSNSTWRYVSCYDDCCDCEASNITHWMELPSVDL
jgi:hypothetical protein